MSKTLSMHPRVLEVGPNSEGKDYFTGDIHGQADALKRALRKNDFNPQTDRLFTVGNFIDFGQQSLEMLELIEQPWFFSVMGLHELLMRSAIESGYYLQWHTDGGDWAFDDNMQLLNRVNKRAKRLNKLPLAIRVTHKKHGQFGLLSASPGRLQDWQEIDELTNEDLLLCLVDDDLPKRKVEKVIGVDCLVVGNLAARKPWSRGNTVGINLGARFLPERGEVTLWKTKRLLKTLEKRSLFQAF